MRIVPAGADDKIFVPVAGRKSESRVI